uniref:Cadherin domain-containing protein n=1 Tax=Knipowitschia caucasica TaxID=637954 RepID=A0AAV2MJF9_KNICA
MKRGSVIGNIAKDVGLDLSRLSARRARVDSEDNGVQFCSVNLNTGELLVQERIDREGLCAKKTSCILKQELVLENPLELHRFTIRVQDINDNAPNGEIRTQRDISESDSMKQNLIVAVKDNGQTPLSATCSMYLLISDNLAEVPELKDISYDERDSKLTSYLIIALVSVSTFFLTFIIIVLGVRFCRRRKPRLLFDGAVAIPSGYLPPNYADVDGTGTLRSTYNYDGYMTTGSRTSDFKFVSSYNDNTLPAEQTLRKSPTDFSDVFGDSDHSLEVGLFH